MKPTLQTRLGQQLSLTPQLRQAIRLLQLSAIELEAELNDALDANPLLEREDEADADDLAAPPEGDKAPEATAADATPDSPDSDDYDPGEAPDWDDSALGSYERRGDGDENSDEFTAAAPVDLQAHLLWQLRLSHLSARDLAIGEALVEAINDDGYLASPMEDIQAALSPEITAEAGEIETVLHIIQHFDPVGAGARTLSECLCVQLSLLSADTPGLALARDVCRKHLDALAKLGPDR
ncbi:MAG: RNA polymerase factor sigma-54, partial [Arenimonas sp.]|nr:RNA polymerase factor sigma-54 [Arenimonas sp.]